MVTLNFNHILLKLASQGSIPQDTLQSQDGLNLGDIHFCPIQQTLHMQHISLDCLWRLIAEGMFMPPMLEGTLELNRTTAILLIFQVKDQHEKITDINVGLVVHNTESHLYAPDKILAFMSDIEVNLKAACDNLKTGGDPSMRHAFCLFINNYGGAMFIPTDLPYCLVYPMSYMKNVEPDHFNTRNNPAGTHLHCCICHITLQHMNDNPHHCREYGGSHLILPHHGLRHQIQLWNLPKPNTLVARAGITVAWDKAPTHPPQNTLTPPQLRSLPVPRSQPRSNRTSLPRVAALASMVIPPPHPLSQPDISRKRPTRKTPTNSTPPFPLAPVDLMAFTFRWDPMVRQPSSSLPPSP